MFGYLGDVVFCFDGSEFLNKKIVNMYSESDLCGYYVFHGSQVFGYLRILDGFLSHLSFAPWKFEAAAWSFFSNASGQILLADHPQS